jgi:hypothetical protein
MTTTAKRFNKDGVEIADVGPLKDGERRSFPMSMMDHALAHVLDDKLAPTVDTSGVRHSPGYCVAPMTDAELVNSEAAMAFRKAQLSQAWQKKPVKPAVPPLKKDEQAAPATDTESLLQARDERLTEAWRTPAPLAGSSTTTDTSTTAVVPDVAAAIAARDARLENAWRAA